MEYIVWKGFNSFDWTSLPFIKKKNQFIIITGMEMTNIDTILFHASLTIYVSFALFFLFFFIHIKQYFAPVKPWHWTVNMITTNLSRTLFLFSFCVYFFFCIIPRKRPCFGINNKRRWEQSIRNQRELLLCDLNDVQLYLQCEYWICWNAKRIFIQKQTKQKRKRKRRLREWIIIMEIIN